MNADDCALMVSGLIINDICDRFKRYLVNLNVFFMAKNMKIFAIKSTVFTTWTRAKERQAYQAGPNGISVDGVIEVMEECRVHNKLGNHPPPIASEERQLSRQTHTVAEQLRSGWCSRFNSYWTQIDSNGPNTCPSGTA